MRRLAASGQPVPVVDLPKGVKLAELEDFDFDDYGDAEREDLELFVIDAATAAQSADELDIEVEELEGLVELADGVRSSGIDTKWTELRALLRSEHFSSASLQPASDGADISGGGRPPAPKLIVFSEHKDTLDYVATASLPSWAGLRRWSGSTAASSATTAAPSRTGSGWTRLYGCWWPPTPPVRVSTSRWPT